LVGVPMSDIVATLPLEHRMKAALRGETTNEYVPLLQLAKCYEEARWEEAEKLARELNLDGKKVKRAFQDSINWAIELESLRVA